MTARGRAVLHSRFVRDDLRVAAVPWLLARVLVVAALAVSREVFTKVGATPRPVQLGQGLFAWDAAFYRDIAEHGYRAVGEASLRFFPLVPLLARGLGWILLGHTAAALIVLANGSALVFGALLHRLALHETGDVGVARRAAWFAALFPAAAVLVLGYAEATAMMLGVVMFLGLRSRRWGWAIGAGLLAGLCRPVGVLLVVPAADRSRAGVAGGAGARAPGPDRRGGRTRRSARRSTWPGSGSPSATPGSPSRSRTAPRSAVGSRTRSPAPSMPSATSSAATASAPGCTCSGRWDSPRSLVVLARRMPASYTWYAAVTLVVGLSASNLDSFERYCMSTFPFLLALALVTEREEVERGAIVLAGAGLVGYAMLAFLGIQGP